MKTRIEQILEDNEKFVQNKEYEHFTTTKYPNKKIAILSCMDTRLTELLPAALNLKNGDVKLIKNAGGLVSHPFGSVMQSLMVAIYSLDVDEVLVIGHYDCGMEGMKAEQLVDKMLEKGITREAVESVSRYGIDLEKWLSGFDNVEDSVADTVKSIKEHPLISDKVKIYGLVMDSVTGALTRIV